MSGHEQELEERLARMVRSSSTLMALLAAARSLHLQSWCIGAGVVRGLVWDHLHGFSQPSRYEDVDVTYYDATADEKQDEGLTRRLLDIHPSARWEVSNQALIHQWFLKAHGQIVPPLRSLADGIATWPEYATCVGVTLNADDTIEVIAPHGLQDLFDLKIRHNAARASAEVFMQRVTSKRLIERWPMLSLVTALSGPD
ncbi:nucleotidyltransferase family protein [Duganella margarita]|nr:nucleotidyltransferase family protein [Duganella margarita]